MKRITALVTAAVLMLVLLPLSGCKAAVPDAENAAAFRLSSVQDVTGADGNRTYRVIAPYSDTYTLTSDDTAVIALYDADTCLAEDADEISVDLTAGDEYILHIKTAQKSAAFSVHTEAKNHRITLPYDVALPADAPPIALGGDGGDPLVPAEVKYQKREGGTYIYSNNPELVPPDAVGDALLRNEGLSGEVYFTFEHANYAGTPFYLGYQLKNDGDTDVYVTVTNIGYQAGGTWFGQCAWYDFYNTAFDLPDDYLTESGAITAKYRNFEYAYTDYEPRVFQPTTYRLPAGEYFWVIGGTAADAYNHISVDGTADKLLGAVKCANGNVKFNVTGGAVTATFYAYDDIAQVEAEPALTGYRVGAYAAQYGGTADHCGVIDNHMQWTFSDETASGALPVTYTNAYDVNASRAHAPYAAYENVTHTTACAESWMTHLNVQNDHRAVGTDIVTFTCTDENGREVVIDNDHADGAGNPANTANWMIEYQDHFTFINQGDTARTVRLCLKDNGTLAVLARNSATGEVLEARYTAGLAESEVSYTYALTVEPHSVSQITLDYLLVACSYGNVQHWVVLE